MGIIASLPPMPTGTIGTPGLGGHVGRAVEQLLHDAGRCWRVPSGNITSGCPPLDDVRAGLQRLAVGAAAVHREAAEHRHEPAERASTSRSMSLPM